MDVVKVAVIAIAVLTARAKCEGEIEIQPNGEITKSVGSQLALTCKLNVDKPDQITQLEWRDPLGRRIDNTNTDTNLYIQNTPDSGSALLVFSQITKDMAGTYTCTAKYSNTEELKASKEIKIIEEIKWKDAPEEQYPKLGETFRVRCEAEANPSASINWERNGVSLTTKDRYIVKANGLIIKDVRESDDGLYKCTAVVISTGEIQIRNIRVEVQIPPKIEPMNNLEIVEGERAQIMCKASGKPPPKYTWIKESSREDLSKTDRFSVKPNEGLLSITRVELIDNSNYTCVAESRAGRDEAYVQLKVLSPPRIYEFLNATVPIKKEAQLICKASGRPAPAVTFRKLSNRQPFQLGIQKEDNRIIVEQRFDPAKGESYGILTITNVQRSDDGLYECIAKNSIRDAYKNGHITVQFAPTFEKTRNLTSVWTWGERLANLSCIPEAIPNATIEWRRQGVTLEGNSTNMWVIGNGPKSFLIVKVGNQQRFLGHYECRARNEIGNDSIIIELKQATVPKPVQQVKIAYITATTITFDIVGPPNFHDLPLRKYVVQYQTERIGHWNNAQNYTWTVGAPSYTLENLIPEVTYNFRFAVINDVGMGGWGGNQQITMPRRSAPAEPKILIPNYHPDDLVQNRDIIISSYADHFDLRWNVPNDNGAPIDMYIIRYCVIEKINGEWKDNLDKCSPEISHSFQYTNYELKNLEPDTVYKIELKAHNSIGSSSPAQIRIRTPRGMNQPIYQEPPISSAMIVAVVVAAILIIILIIDIACCYISRSGILAYILEKIKSKPTDEEDPKLGSYKAASAHPSSLNLPQPIKLSTTPMDEKEPLKPDRGNQPEFISPDKRNISVEFDGHRVYSRPGDIIIGKNSAV
ncbi:fasciclin-2 isoform X2 [Agrilus planipennis]|uniref:Fasciclin-2 isoform X2 n=1 Tax=Agrilus planipennis TaxID=224129 RepID=A0A1W4XFL6_AGRPL|nr:fasciclin-2 isoform X2 [Agrilus planipennis]